MDVGTNLTFSIGTYFPKKKTKREKVLARTKKTTMNEMFMPNIIFQKNPIKFSVTCERWKIPPGIPVNPSIETKFITLNYIYSYRKIVTEIKDAIQQIRFKCVPSLPFEPSKCVKALIQSYYSKQENEWNKVRGIYLRLFKFKNFMTPLIYKWRLRTTLANIKNVEDPVTMEIPRKSVFILDIKKRMTFVYDANSLRRVIESRLLFSDYMFPEPQEPVNPLTNEVLTYGQLMSVIRQCRKHGESSWALDELQRYGSVIKFNIYNQQKLNLEAIHVFFKKSRYVIRETVLDFFRMESEDSDLPLHAYTRFVKRYDSEPDHPLIQKWINNTRDYYIAKELNNGYLILTNSARTTDLLNEVYRLFMGYG